MFWRSLTTPPTQAMLPSEHTNNAFIFQILNQALNIIMKILFGILLLLLLPAYGHSADTPPDWAFLVPTPAKAPPATDDGQLRHRRGSAKAYTQEQIDDVFNPPDWYPDEHPLMPDLVAHGKPPVVMGCAVCHLTNGR